MRKFYDKYKYILPAILFFLGYTAWFTWIENRPVSNLHIIHLKLDDYIPFCEWFVIPYLLWFAYVAATIVYLCFMDRRAFCSSCIFLFTGMLLFLVISTVFPNGQDLRPAVMPRDNVLTRLIQTIYLADTPTNILPSIHVYNAIGAHLAILKSSRLSSKKGLPAASLVLCVLIILSTVFIKQHSVLDVISAMLLAGILYTFVYRNEFAKSVKFKKPLADSVTVD